MILKRCHNVALIRDIDHLAQFVSAVAGASSLAVDTEFAREDTYFADLCLVQIAADDTLGLVDTKAIEDLSPLGRLFADPAITKIFHAAVQDLEVLVQRLGVMPAPVFDTQIAAAMLDHGDQTGYATLVERVTGITLAKSHTRTDWRRRPLSDAALAYAADDVRYLAAVRDHLQQALDEAGRLAWLEEDCERLTDASRYQPDPDQAWHRLRGIDRLDRQQQTRAVALAKWRENEAIRADRPRRWILSDDVTLELARQAPVDEAGLSATPGLPSRTRARHARQLLATIESASAQPSTAAVAPAPPDADTRRRIKSGMQRVRQCAANAGIAASLLASRADIAALIDNRPSRLDTGWRAELAGPAVAEAITQRHR